MRNISYIIWGAWLLAGIVLKILGLCSWWFATSALWLPAAVGVSAMVVIFATSDFAAIAKKTQEARVPEECANCLFGRTADLINATRREGEERALCIGEKLANATRGVVCEYYQREK